MKTLLTTLVSLPLLAAALPLSAQAGPNPSELEAERSVAAPARNTLQAVRATGPIKIDGVADDAGWTGSERVRGFSEVFPMDGRPAAEDTEVWIAYGDAHLYVAFIAQADPKMVRATHGQRDKAFNDDLVLVTIDPRGTAEWGYAFGANPLGVQLDGRATGLDLDPRLDLVFEAAGRLTDNGYVVELAIPFSSLQVTPGERPWKINFSRAHPRQTRYLSSWSPIRQDNPCALCQSGTIAGFEGVVTRGTWSLMPSLVAQQASTRPQAGSALDHGGLQADPSLSASYRAASGWSIEGTYNPDFSQVESDVAQIDVNSTLAISYPEKRPFFQQGADLFATPLNTVYTRAINDPQGAVKVRGEAGGWQLGYLGAYDETSPYMVPLRERTLLGSAGASQSHVLRAKRSLGEGAYLGAMLTDRSYAAGMRGTTFGIDGSQRFATVYGLAYQLVGSHTQEGGTQVLNASGHGFEHGGRSYTAAQDGESFTGLGGRLSLSRDDGRTRVAARYDFATPTLRMDNGLLRSNDYHDVELSAGMRIKPASSLIDDISSRVEVGREWSFDGRGQRQYVEPSLGMMFTRQTVVGAFYYRADETYRGVRFDGIDKATLFAGTHFSDRLGVSVRAKYGDEIVRTTAEPSAGRELFAAARLTLKPTTRLALLPQFSFARMSLAETGEEVYRGSISRLDASYQVNRELSVRLVTQYNSFADRLEVDPLITYQISPFSMFYIGSTHDLHPDAVADAPWMLSQRQIFLKFQYQFRG